MNMLWRVDAMLGWNHFKKGSIVNKSLVIYVGCFGNDKETASTLDSKGWLKIEDLCYIDEEGFFLFWIK